MIKSILRTTFVVAATTAVVAGTAAAQTATQDVILTVPATNAFTVSGAPNLAPAPLTAGQDTTSATDASATYDISTSTGSTTPGSVTAHISTGTVPTGTKLLVEFAASGDNVSSEQELNGATSIAPVTVLSGLAMESVAGQLITYTFKSTAAAVAGTTPVTVTYTFTPGT